ncbi:hypothetical protein [Dokdonella ginsengisoli]|uniref:Uncharacterized protein n=1 Tax=Dokdonella ginsengisoli TaxID=363846 RepID=A0ABV9QVA2_9GAMM
MSTAAARDVPATSPAAWMEILRLTGRLLAEHWPALLFWFFLQRVLYGLLLDAAIALVATSLLLAYAVIALLVVSQLATVIAMFLCLRPSLPMLSRRDVPQQIGLGGGHQAWTRALAVALLPFFAYYTTWGLLDGLRRDFQISFVQNYAFTDTLKTSAPKDVLHQPYLWLALIVAWAVRAFAQRRAKQQDGRIGWSLLATACEAYWVFVGARAIAQAIGIGKDWWQERAVYQALTRWWDDPRALFHLLAPIKQALAPAWDLATTAFGGVVTPMVWLAITAIIYGMDMRRKQKLDAADAHLSRLGARYSALPLLVRKMAGKASEGWTSKGVPITNSLRLVLRAGLPAVVVLCVCYQLLDWIDSHSLRAVVALVGPRDDLWWNTVGQPLAVLIGTPSAVQPALLTEIVRIALLAAACDCAIARLQSAPADAPAATGGPAAAATG